MKRRWSHQFNAVSALKDSRFLRFVKQNGNNRRSVYDQFHTYNCTIARAIGQ